MPLEIVGCPQPGCDGIADGEVEYVYDAGGNVVGRLVKRILRCRTCEYADGAAAHGDYGGVLMYSHRLSHAYRATH